MPAVVSRPLEFRAVTEFLRSATQQPSGLVIEGEPGIGKTTLWLSALEEARGRGYRVFSARVGQAESVLAYAAVADLLRDIDDSVLAELSDVQRVAVDRVLLRASSEDHTTDQHVVAAAFAAVFDRLATDSPVLIAIDDLQWLDRSSKDVLAFAARRFKGGIGLLVTERSDAEGGSSVTWLHLSRPDRIERVRVGPLSIGGLHMLISSRLGRSLPRPTMVRIAETSGGNPFFALELARAIDIGSSQAKSKLPSSLSELMRLRIGQLDRDARKLLRPPPRLPTRRWSCSLRSPALPSSRLATQKPRASSGLTAISCDSPTRCWPRASIPTRPRPSAAPCTGRWRRP